MSRCQSSDPNVTTETTGEFPQYTGHTGLKQQQHQQQQQQQQQPKIQTTGKLH